MDNHKIKLVLGLVAVVAVAIIAIKVLTFALKLLLPLAFVALIIFGAYWLIKKRR